MVFGIILFLVYGLPTRIKSSAYLTFTSRQRSLGALHITSHFSSGNRILGAKVHTADNSDSLDRQPSVSSTWNARGPSTENMFINVSERAVVAMR